MTNKVTVGKDVLSYCGKCKLSLSHIIVTMKNENTIHKVQCNTCKATHVYKDPALAKIKKKTTKTGTRKKTVSVPVHELWMNAIENATSKSEPYSIKNTYKEGDVIDHPKFGPGVIEKVVDNDKVSIIFRHDIKLLVHNR